eukprot:CAMPEP_0117854230 /NCGR_PEP_ID=MMETSP0949-20121206/24198_1 /TAXON_ID=44440 /ORGANISM="Chattonella subsalsa, Strain CCMP2191" /LENGTH=146 /DNA_ID=CAMNT_0005702853 /DNA_START=83 /DNA_END=520 /DNA_ORIENTATION=-
MYQCTSGPSLSAQSPLALEFKQRFPSTSIGQVLAKFGIGRTHDYLQQIHKYLYFAVPEHKSSNGPSTYAEDTLNVLHGTSNSFSPAHGFANDIMPSTLNPHEMQYLESLSGSGNSHLYNLFRRLCSHFRGKDHTTELIWKGLATIE